MQYMQIIITLILLDCAVCEYLWKWMGSYICKLLPLDQTPACYYSNCIQGSLKNVGQGYHTFTLIGVLT